MPTGLARCSVGMGISRGAHKLARTPRIIKKKKKKKNNNMGMLFACIFIFIFSFYLED